MQGQAEIEKPIYKIGLNHYFLLSLLSSLALTYGFISNFSLEKKIEDTLKSQLSKMRSCPVGFEKLSLSYFIPGLNLSDISVSPRCYRGEDEILINSVTSQISFPSFSPIGPTLSTVIKDKFSNIKITSAHGISEHKIRIESRKLSAQSFNPVLRQAQIKGDFNVTAVSTLDTRNLKSLQLNLKSNNLNIPAQNINSFSLPNLDIRNFALIANLSNKSLLNIKKFIIGDEKSPIRANIKGKIDLNMKSIVRSKLDLNIVVKFSEQFQESFGIISLFLDSNKQDENGFYTINVTGTLNKPKHTVIQK